MNQRTLFISRDGAAPALGQTEAALREALDAEESRHGPDHPDVAITLNNLAALLLESGRAQEALPLIVRARDIVLGAFEGDHAWKHATYDTLVAIVRQLDIEGAAPPNLRPFAAQIRALDEAARGRPAPVTPPPAPVATPAPELAPIAVAPLPPPAPASPARTPPTEPETRASPLGTLGNFIFGVRPPRKK